MPNGIELTFEELIQVPPLTQLLPNTMVASQRYGILRSISKGRGMEFSEVRAYLPGDDIRNIDWRITARTGRPYTKMFREERDRNVYIILDLDPAMYFGSQGQQRSAVLSMKLAEATLADQITGTRPVILLDDVMSELDNVRKSFLLNELKEKQVFITCCDEASVSALARGKVFTVKSGDVSEK